MSYGHVNKGRKNRQGGTLKCQWLALFTFYAMVIQTVLPFAQALAIAPDQGIQYQVICTANGIKQIPLEGNDTPVNRVPNSSCPLCTLASSMVFVKPQLTAIVSFEEEQAHSCYEIDRELVAHERWQVRSRLSRAPPFEI